MSICRAYESSHESLSLGVALGTPGATLRHLIQAPFWPRHLSPCPHCCLQTHQHMLFPLSGAPSPQPSFFLTSFKAPSQYHPSGKQSSTTQCNTAPVPSFSVPSSCFVVLVNTYHLIYLYLLVSWLAVHPQLPTPEWKLHKAVIFHFVSDLSEPPQGMLGWNDKMSGICFKGFYRTKSMLLCPREPGTHLINCLMQNGCLSFCYYTVKTGYHVLTAIGNLLRWIF